MNATLEHVRAQFTENVAAIEKSIKAKDERIQLLESALARLVTLVEDTNDNTEGRWPGPEPSCNECTGGCTPIQYDKGLCALHQARKLLKPR